MALNVAVFRTRALTSVVFVAVMLAGLFTGQWSFLALFTIIHFGCWVEYQKIMALIYKDYAGLGIVHKYGVMLAGWGFMLIMTSGAYTIGPLSLKTCGIWVLCTAAGLTILAEIIGSGFTLGIKRLGISFLGLLYISFSWGLMIRLWSKGILYETATGYLTVIPLIASIWINDTFAYIVGSLIGKTQFSKISPQKTWEGTIGGAVLAVITVSALGMILEMNFFVTMFLSLTAVTGAILGDLLESWLKRQAGVKDSGHIMPGHGGFLDRFDSMLVATPLVWLYIVIFPLVN